jgi:DnaK suppressor protein
LAKKTSKKSAASKKPGTSRKTTTRKKAAAKKPPAKKSSSAKKTTSKKKTTTIKKTSTKKAASKKAPAKKSAPKKAATEKPAAKKPSTTKKTAAPAKKGAGSKSSKKQAGANGDATTGKGARKPAEVNPNRFRSVFAGGGTTGREAAAKLAAAAGLAGVRSSARADTHREKKYRRISKSPLSPKQLAEFRELLIVKRRQLLGDVTSMENEALGGNGGSLSHLPQHMADQGSDTFDQSLNLDLAASQRGLLKEIDDALDRIDGNVYGICELLGKPIKLERLRNTPWARFSIEAAREIEKNPFLLRKNDDD